MKKLLVILSACFVMVSCQFWHETFDSPAECTEWYLEQIYEAGLDGDVSKVAELNADYQEWLLDLDESEAAEAGLAALAWLESHPEILEVLEQGLGGLDYDDYDDYDDYGW